MKRAWIILFCLLTSIGVFGQELVKDINTIPGSITGGDYDNSQLCYPCNNLVFFTAENTMGKELWKTDGTSVGTLQITDLYPGPESGVFDHNLRCLNNKIYFIGRNSGIDRKLFESDGTEAGTRIVVDQEVSDFALFQGKLVTVENDKFWIHNANENPSLIKEFETSGEERLGYIQVFGGQSNILIVRHIRDDIGPLRSELWSSDGTTEGTLFLRSYKSIAQTNFGGFNELGSQVLFGASDEEYQFDLWKTDGTVEGTMIVRDNGGGSFRFLGEFQGKLIYAGSGTYITDGTSEGTELLMPNYPSAFKGFADKFYFTGHSAGDIVLFVSDGSPEGTTMINTLGPSDFVTLFHTLPYLNGKLIVPGYSDETGQELFYSEGQNEDLTLLKDINAGTDSSFPKSFAELGSKLIFIAKDGITGAELWSSDGTPAGTQLLKDVIPGTESSNIVLTHILNERLFFRADEGADVRKLWFSDGSPSGTERYYYDFSSPFLLGEADGELLILDNKKFWRTNGMDNTSLVWDFNGLSSSYGISSSTIYVNNKLFFYFSNDDSQDELWRWNTIDNSLTITKDIYPGLASSFVSTSRAIIDNDLLFFANDGSTGKELWKTDGSEEGTQLVKDINPGNSTPAFLTAVGDVAFFRANDGLNGDELWKSDGTSEGTVLVKDILLGADGSSPSFLAKFGNKVVFTADDGTHGIEPWISDGTESGTALLKDINEFGTSSALWFHEFKNLMYFTANDGIHGIELWVTDGSSLGTVVIDLAPGEKSSNPYRLMDDGTNLFFHADGKVWRSTSNPLVFEIIGAFEPSGDFISVGENLLFTYSTEATGNELYKLLKSGPTVTSTQQITFSEIADKQIGDPAFDLTASTTSGLSVVFTTNSEKITLNNTSVMLLAPGSVTINADQAGDNYYLPAPTISQTFCINPAQPTISLSGDSDQPTLTSSSTVGNQWYKDEILLDGTTTSLNVTQSGTYKVRVMIDGCKSELSEGKTILITGIENKDTLMEVHPNPTSGTLNISIEGEQTVQIVNSNGVVLFNEKVAAGEHQLDISGYSSGVYILKLISNRGTELKRWVKQ